MCFLHVSVMITDVFLVILTVFSVFSVEIPVVVLLTPRLVVWWIRRNAGAILTDMLQDEAVRNLLNEASQKLIGHIVGGQGGRPISLKGIVTQVASQVAMQWISKSGIVPKGVAEVATEAAKEIK
jgi:hypothetical protein